MGSSSFVPVGNQDRAGTLGLYYSSPVNPKQGEHMKDYYEQLIGATITHYEEVKDEHALDPFPVFLMKLKDGTKVQVDVSRDEEGNGGGFLFIAPAERNSQ